MDTHKFYTKKDKAVLFVGYIILGAFVAVVAIPLLYVVIASFVDPGVLANKGLSFNPADWTLDGYTRVFKDQLIWRGFFNSFLYSIVFSILSVVVTLLAAYPLSRPEFVGRKFFNAFFLFTMFFSGGLMPTYLLIQNIGLMNNPLALILPGAVNVWNIVLARTYYKNIPGELREAAAVDGASDIKFFFKIMMPVCKPIILVIILYQFVSMWNGYFDALLYIDNQSLQPLQLVLRSILVQNTPRPGMISDAQSVAMMAKIAEQLKYSTIVIASLPLMLMFPFFQKYFEEGVMSGSVKG